MHLGKYFIYCPLSSGADFHVFRYTVIEDKGTDKDKDKKSFVSRFPIYLIIDPSSIYAAFAGNMPHPEESGEKIHIHAEIISVAITDYNKRHTDAFSSFLCNDMHKPVDLTKKYAKEKCYTNWITFNEKPLPDFPGKDSFHKDGAILPSRLFLDLLTDLFHSRVFDRQPGIDSIREKLGGHYLCRSILAQQQYVYGKKELNDWSKEHVTGTLPDIYLENFVNARNNWTQALDHEHGYYLFEVKKCFDTSLKEMTEVAKDKPQQLINRVPKEEASMLEEKINSNNHRIVAFFIERMDIFHALKTLITSHKLMAGILTIIAVSFVSFLLYLNHGLANYSHTLIILVAAFGLFYSITLPGLFIVRDFILSRYNKKKLRLNSWAPMFFPIVSIGIIAAWSVYMPVSGDSLKLSLIEPVISFQYLWFVICCTIFTLLAIYFTIKLKVPEYREATYGWKNCLFLCFAGISFSIFCGFFIMHFNTRKLLLDKDSKYMPAGYFSQTLQNDIANHEKAEILQYNFNKAIYRFPDTAHINSITIPEKDSLFVFLNATGIKPNSTRLIKMLQSDNTIAYYQSTDWNNHFNEFQNWFYDDKIEAPAVLLAERLKHKNYGPQYIAQLDMFGVHWFYYPRLLLLYSFIAFYLGFLFQFIINFSNKHASRST